MCHIAFNFFFSLTNTMCLRLLLSFVLLTYNTGFSAETSVFVKTGDSVQLDIQTQELQLFDILTWRNDKSENIVRWINGTKEIKLLPSYKDRVSFNDQTFSLTLKNMQKKDSGVYNAKTNGDSENIIVTYRISVIDEVESPVLTANPSPNLCSLICKGSNINISLNINGSLCSQEEVISADNYTLRVNCSDDHVMCNYSNPVSWKTERKNVNDLCPVNQEILSQTFDRRNWFIPLICLSTLGLLACMIGFCFKRNKERSYDTAQQTDELTLYEKVGEMVKPEKPLETESSAGPTTVYDTVREHRLTDVTVETNTSLNSDPVDQDTTEKGRPHSPVTAYKAIQQQPQSKPDQTIYAAVNKPSARNETEHP